MNLLWFDFVVSIVLPSMQSELNWRGLEVVTLSSEKDKNPETLAKKLSGREKLETNSAACWDFEILKETL